VNKTKIEWVKNPDGSQGYTWNPITGCLNNDNGLCKGGGFPCYAYKLANTRLKQRYLEHANLAIPDGETHKHLYLKNEHYRDPFYPRFWEERLHEPDIEPTKPQHMKGIFVCDMGDLFGIGIPEVWTREVLNIIWSNPWHRFYLLTKQPQNLIKFSPFPENCWVGVTATDSLMLVEALARLEGIKASVKYVSLEPLLAQINDPTRFFKSLSDCLSIVDWLIIGACTGTYSEMTRLCALKNMSYTDKKPFGNKWTLQPKIEWLQEIVEAADKAGVPVFLKDNLRPLLEKQDITDTSFGRLTSLKVEAMKDTQGLPRQRGWYELRQEMPNQERVAIPERI